MKKIIIAEDDKFLVRVYKAKLLDLGYEVTLLEDGSQVYKKAKEIQPDLIVLDIVMPKKNGFDVIEELKNDSKTKSIPILVLTNLSQDEDKEKLIKMGVKKFLVKSDLSFEKVIEEVRAIMK